MPNVKMTKPSEYSRRFYKEFREFMVREFQNLEQLYRAMENLFDEEEVKRFNAQLRAMDSEALIGYNSYRFEAYDYPNIRLIVLNKLSARETIFIGTITPASTLHITNRVSRSSRNRETALAGIRKIVHEGRARQEKQDQKGLF